MSIHKLIEKAREYSISEEEIVDRENDRLSFIKQFPLDSLKDLSIDQFVQGTDDNSFCYWLEFKKIGFGIGGGNASKFGIYKTKSNGDLIYAVGSGKNKTFLGDKEASDYFKSLLGKVILALEHSKNDEIEKIRKLDLPLWNMVLQKILSIYYPEKFLTIGSPSVLIKCAKELEVENIELTPENSIQINYECKRLLSNNNEFKNWPPEKIGKFIWEFFGGENKKRKRKDSKQYWLYAPGENAHLWDEFYELGIMGLGWDEIGDLSQYKIRDEIKSALVEAYGGTGSKKNDVSANNDFLNKINVGDIIITKKGRGELLGYGIVKSDYKYDQSRASYQKIRKVDWQLKGEWKVDFSLVLKTLTDITSYSSDHPDHETYYERLMEIMTKDQTSMENRKNFIVWLNKKYGENTGTTSSYIKAIDILSQILSQDLFQTTDDKYLGNLYLDLIKEQRNQDGKYYHADAPSYGSNGFYSASIKSYREFLKSNHQIMGNKNTQMDFPLNTILYGPPGTGKTYNTVLRAAEIIENRKIHSYNEALRIFKTHLHDQIEFITFHQNYSYEDFIQGIRPDTENDKELTFERKDGVFKIMANNALKNLLASKRPPIAKKTFEETFNEFVGPLVEGEVEEIEVQMKKVSYFITAVTNKSIEFRKTSGGTGHTLSIATLRKMYDAESALDIQGLSSYYSPLLEELLKIGKDPSGRKEIVQRKNYVIIIDEINRANISRVFGELITLIEPDKRSHGNLPMEARLPSGDTFVVPSNLYIIGTMNTADKSIALLDIALRRRFEFESMYPKYEIDDHEIYDVDILKKINEKIIKSKGHDFQIGHAYFMGKNKDLVQRMNKKVIPLLLEYYMNDEKEVKAILQSSGLIIEENSWPIRITDKND